MIMNYNIRFINKSEKVGHGAESEASNRSINRVLLITNILYKTDKTHKYCFESSA